MGDSAKDAFARRGTGRASGPGSVNAENLIARLDAVRTTGPGRWVARCPAHLDQHPSLAIRGLEGGRTLVHCFAGCSVDSVVWALGLRLWDLFPPRSSDHPPERRPWPAKDVLCAVAHESLIAAIAIETVARGEILSTEDRDRGLLAAQRLRDAAVLGSTS
jgi:hypothetical protein